MASSEIAFEVDEAVEDGYHASALGYDTITQADSWDELEVEAQEALLCYFDDGCAPKVIRLHRVKNTVIAV